MTQFDSGGNRGPMVKHIRFMRRRDGVSADEFQEVWLRHHAPIMAERTQALRYYQVSFPPDPEGREQPFHQAATLWYRDEEHWKRAYATPPPLEDDPTMRMVDRGAGLLLVTTEHVLLDGPDAPDTSTWYLRPSLSSEAVGSVMPTEWERDLEVLSRASESPPIRVVTSVARKPTLDARVHGLTEVGWATTSAQNLGDDLPAVRQLFGDSIQLHPAQRVIVLPRSSSAD